MTAARELGRCDRPAANRVVAQIPLVSDRRASPRARAGSGWPTPMTTRSRTSTRTSRTVVGTLSFGDHRRWRGRRLGRAVDGRLDARGGRSRSTRRSGRVLQAGPGGRRTGARQQPESDRGRRRRDVGRERCLRGRCGSAAQRRDRLADRRRQPSERNRDRRRGDMGDRRRGRHRVADRLHRRVSTPIPVGPGRERHRRRRRRGLGRRHARRHARADRSDDRLGHDHDRRRRRPRGVAFGDGSVWVADSGDGTVVTRRPAQRPRDRDDPGRPEPPGAGRRPPAACGSPSRRSPRRSRRRRRGARRGAAHRARAAVLSRLDPALVGNVSTCRRSRCSTRRAPGLLTYPDRPAPQGTRLVPDVAPSLPTVSAGGRTYTFIVRPRVSLLAAVGRAGDRGDVQAHDRARARPGIEGVRARPSCATSSGARLQRRQERTSRRGHRQRRPAGDPPHRSRAGPPGADRDDRLLRRPRRHAR